ncbi:MAG: type IV toxin-antitoxin system AbiEi family antitoxin domain-containing protein [Solirubrobacteraceae bacterium]
MHSGPNHPPEPDERAARLAAKQHGNVTLPQLHALGLNARAIQHRVRMGRVFRVHPGVYSVGRPPTTPLERASAAVLACGPTAVLSHLGALKLWGFADRWPQTFEVTVSSGDPRPRGIVVHRSKTLARHDVRVQLGVRATSPARTIVDCASLIGPKRLTRVVHDALRSPSLTEAQLSDCCARLPTHAGARLVGQVIAGIDGAPTRSDFEVEFIAFCERFGLPRPQTNVRVAGHEVDALFEAQRVIVELDGWHFHRDRATFESDRERDAATLLAGHLTLRLTWERMTRHPAREAARLRRILNR